jgi:hypothetical protein
VKFSVLLSTMPSRPQLLKERIGMRCKAVHIARIIGNQGVRECRRQHRRSNRMKRSRGTKWLPQQ